MTASTIKTQFGIKVKSVSEALKGILGELWNAAEESGFCCGIRLASTTRVESMPTPSSCCGVRF